MPKPKGKERWLKYFGKIDCNALEFPEWQEITGFGLGQFGQYAISCNGVFIRKHSEDYIRMARPKEQPELIRFNQQEGLTFPCTALQLVQFVEGPGGAVGGKHFSLPKGFREAVELITAGDAPTAVANRKTKATQNYPPDWIEKAKQLAQSIGQADWSNGIRQISARSLAERVAEELQKDVTTYGQRGPLSSNYVRTNGLKGWNFIPPLDS